MICHDLLYICSAQCIPFVLKNPISGMVTLILIKSTKSYEGKLVNM